MPGQSDCTEPLVEVEAKQVLQLLKQKAANDDDLLLQSQLETCFWQAAHIGLLETFRTANLAHVESLEELGAIVEEGKNT